MEQQEKGDVNRSNEEQNPVPSLSSSFPLRKIKRIMNLDRDIKKATSEATLLISLATELFLASLTTGAHTAVVSRKRRVIRSEDVRSAVKSHAPTADFLLDCLPAVAPAPASVRRTGGDKDEMGVEDERLLPRGTRRIDQIFQKVSVDSEIVTDSGAVN